MSSTHEKDHAWLFAILPNEGEEFRRICFTPDMASRALNDFPYEYQRPLDAPTVDKYAKEYRRGEWLAQVEPITLAVLEDAQYLTNGRHRLNAIIKADMNVSLIVCKAVVADKEALNKLYALTDQPRARTWYQSIKVMELDKQLGLAPHLINKCNGALRYIHMVFNKSKELPTPFEQQEWVVQWQEALRAYADVVGRPTHSRHLYSAPVMAVGLITLRYAPTPATEFWRRVSRSVDLVEHSPEHTLNRFLSSTQSVHAFGRAQLARKVASAWNAYYENRPLHFLQGGATTLKGTPYNNI